MNVHELPERQEAVVLDRMAGGKLWLMGANEAPANRTGSARDIVEDLQREAWDEMSRAMLGSPPTVLGAASAASHAAITLHHEIRSRW